MAQPRKQSSRRSRKKPTAQIVEFDPGRRLARAEKAAIADRAAPDEASERLRAAPQRQLYSPDVPYIGPGSHAIQARRRGFTNQSTSYQPPGDGDEVDPYLAADLALTKAIAEKLEQHYPAHPWMVKVTHAQGVAMIKLPILMKAHEEWVIHIKSLRNDPGLRLVVRAGGALLERHNVPRHGFMLDHFLHARDKVRKPKPRLLVPEFYSSARPREAV